MQRRGLSAVLSSCFRGQRLSITWVIQKSSPSMSLVRLTRLFHSRKSFWRAMSCSHCTVSGLQPSLDQSSGPGAANGVDSGMTDFPSILSKVLM